MKKSYQALKYLCWDFCAAILAWLCFYYFSIQLYQENIFIPIHLPPYITTSLIGAIWLLIYSFSGFYVNVLQKSRVKECFLLLFVAVIGVVTIFFFFYIDNHWTNSTHTIYNLLFLYFGLHATISIMAKMVVMSISKYQIRHKTIYYNSLLIGSNQTAQDVYSDLETKNRYLGLKFLAYIHVGSEKFDFFEGKLKHLGGIENLDKIIRRCKIEQVVIAIEPSEHQKIAEILTKLEGLNVKISIIPDMYQMLIGSVSISHVLGVPLIEIKQELLPAWQNTIKRVMDIFVSLSVLVLGFPIFIITALITKFTSEGPIIYQQTRVGKHAKPFKIYKFRSMYVGAENHGYALSKHNDPRITPWGKLMRKTRLDEFPQFYNVLIGNMSLVGPRPERQHFINKIIEIAPHYTHLHKVKPGITSLGQVKFGYAENVIEMVQRLEYDIIYIENMSILMDIKILIHTVLTVLSAKGK